MQNFDLYLNAQALDVVEANPTGKIGEAIRGAARNSETKRVLRREILTCGERETGDCGIAAADSGRAVLFWRDGEKRRIAVRASPDQAVGTEADGGATRTFAKQRLQRAACRSGASNSAVDNPLSFFLIGFCEIGALLQPEA